MGALVAFGEISMTLDPVKNNIYRHHLQVFGSLNSLARVHFSDLSVPQIDMISNGCGPRGWGAIPDWGFTESCEEHDFDYWNGGTAEDRLKADQKLRDAMILDARWCYKNPIRRWFRYGMAWVYYLCIRMGGWYCWNNVPGNAKTLLHETLDYYS